MEEEKKKKLKRRLLGILVLILGVAIAVGVSAIAVVVFADASQTTQNILFLFSFVGTVIAVYAIGAFILRNPIPMNMTDSHGGKNYLKGVIVGAMMILTYTIIALMSGGITYAGLGGLSIVSFILYVIAFAIQGFAEELLIRGLLQELIAKKNRLLSIIAPSILFSLLHLGNDSFSIVAMINTALIGVLFALMTDVTGSLWLASGAHSVWNFLMGPVLGLYVSGIPMDKSVFALLPIEDREVINGGLYGPEGSLLISSIILLSIMLYLVGYARKR